MMLSQNERWKMNRRKKLAFPHKQWSRCSPHRDVMHLEEVGATKLKTIEWKWNIINVGWPHHTNDIPHPSVSQRSALIAPTPPSCGIFEFKLSTPAEYSLGWWGHEEFSRGVLYPKKEGKLSTNGLRNTSTTLSWLVRFPIPKIIRLPGGLSVFLWVFGNA